MFSLVSSLALKGGIEIILLALELAKCYICCPCQGAGFYEDLQICRKDILNHVYQASGFFLLIPSLCR